MIDLTLIGIGTGNPQHLTLQAVQALAAQDAHLETAEPSACFAALRSWKDRF